jgi:tetratricopeptide (TPR) repeat protein
MSPRLWIFLTFLTFTAPSFAQTSATMSADARAHFEAGGRFYGLRRFDDAAREFQTAFALSGNAAVLFNLGRALEDSDHLQEALEAYQRFDREGPASFDRAPLRERIAAVQARLAAPRPIEPARPVDPVPPVAPVRPDIVVGPRQPPPAPSRALPIGLMIGGGAAIVGSLALGATVMATDSDLASACRNGVCPAPGRADDVASGQTRALVADVLGGVGLAALAVGAVLWLVRAPSATPARTSLVFTGQGASATVSF